MALNRFVLIALLSIILSLSIPISSKAIHKGAGDLVCGQCHTMHSSQGGTNSSSMGGTTGSFILLRSGNSSINSRAEMHKLCLQCHASYGTQATIAHAPQNVIAPKVSSTGAWTGNENQAFRLIGAGGNFYTELGGGFDTVTPVALGYGHSLGAPSSVTPPGGDQLIGNEGFSCTNCHDPHGTSATTDAKINRFRNLRVYAIGAGLNSGIKFYDDGVVYYTMKSYVGGVNGAYFGGNETDVAGQVIWPIYRNSLSGNPVNDSSDSNSYATGADNCILGCTFGNVAVTMSVWCAQCHDKWHEDIEPTNKAHVFVGPTWWDIDSRRHAVNSMVPRASEAGCAVDCHVSLLDRSNYDSTLIAAGRGLPVTSSNYYTGYVYYLPKCGEVSNPACSGMDAPVGGDNHKVFCLTCHFAHAGPYYDALRWDYTSAVSTGSQSGKAIPSNVGCQLCHNR